MNQAVDRDISHTTADLPDNTVLYTTYYRCGSDERQAEINECLRRNLECKSLERIVVICESGIRPRIDSKNMTMIYVDRRQTYRDIFNYAEMANADGINIFTNSDIWITDEAIKGIKDRIPKYSKIMLALTRWEVIDGKETMTVGADSQDTWAWFGTVHRNIKCNFKFGVPGCDNAIAHRMNQFYEVLNPSLSVKTFHLHKSGEHTYKAHDRIPPPYYFPPITK